MVRYLVSLAAESHPYEPTEPVLVVGLDGILVKTNLLLESLFVLLKREPWTVSPVRVTVPGAVSGFQLRPSVTVQIPAALFANWEFQINWDGMGADRGFSNRFIVTVDAGVDYGQDEVWLYVSKWS